MGAATQERQEIEVGDRVRSYDFPESRDSYEDPDSLRYGQHCYVEGTVMRIGSPPPLVARASGRCARYHIKVEQVVWSGTEKPEDSRIGEMVFPPVNGTPRLMGESTDGVAKLEG